MEGWIAVAHTDWFDHLSQRGGWDEVNFWSPSDYYTFRGTPGAPFFFKLKSPRNAIGGFGYVASYSRLPDWLAWDCFGEGNGATSFDELQRRLDELRKTNRLTGRGGPAQIGCILLVQCVFFPPSGWVRQPSDWAVRNQRYTRYDLATGEGRRVWDECRATAAALLPEPAVAPIHVREQREGYGAPVLMTPRLGQGTFRVAVTDAYGRACAVTHEHSLPALEAAHIRDYARGGPHDVRNGLLLRSDLHRLFDRGFVTVTPALRLEVSRRLKDDYRNGRSYYPLHGSLIEVPGSAAARPAAEFLRWHNNCKYLG